MIHSCVTARVRTAFTSSYVTYDPVCWFRYRGVYYLRPTSGSPVRTFQSTVPIESESKDVSIEKNYRTCAQPQALFWTAPDIIRDVPPPYYQLKYELFHSYRPRCVPDSSAQISILCPSRLIMSLKRIPNCHSVIHIEHMFQSLWL